MPEIFNENLFSERFRIQTCRLNNWDYANPGWYFITINTHYKYPFFGDIKNNNVILSDIGKIAQKYWREIPMHFDNVELDEYIVMPNHVHGIVRIKYKYNHHVVVETRHASSLRIKINASSLQNIQNKILNQNKSINPKPNISPKPKSIPIIIGSFKSICTREINKIPHQIRFFHWQPRYYDRVIRNKIELNKIRYYIKNNPKKFKIQN